MKRVTHNERVLNLLADGKPHSHLELYALHVVAHSRVAELRRRGHRIECWRDGELHMYRLVGALKESVSVSPDVADDCSPLSSAALLEGAGPYPTPGRTPDGSRALPAPSPLPPDVAVEHEDGQFRLVAA